MAKRSKPSDNFKQEWKKAVYQRRAQMRRKKQGVAVAENHEQDAAPKSHLRDAVLLLAQLGKCRLGHQYHPSLVVVPLKVLLDAIAMDDGV